MRKDGAATKQGGRGLLTAGVVVAGVSAVVFYLSLRSDIAPSEAELAAVVAPGASQPDDVPVTSETVENSPPEAVAADEALAEKPQDIAAEEKTPVIDEVRVESDGLTVIAGRAEPGSTVSVLVDGGEVARAITDERGAYAAVTFIDPSNAARVLTLEADTGAGAVKSTGDVILAPAAPQEAQEVPLATAQARAGDQAADQTATSTPGVIADPLHGDDRVAASTRPDETPEEKGGETIVAQGGASPTAQAPEPSEIQANGTPHPSPTPPAEGIMSLAPDVTAPAPRPDVSVSQAPDEAPRNVAPLPEAGNAQIEVANAAPQDRETPAPTQPSAEPAPQNQPVVVLKSTEEGVSLLQSNAPPAVSIDIDTIGYSDEGDVQLAGRAVPGSVEARVYIDNRFVSSLQVDDTGTWRGTVPDVDEGLYVLRVDELSPEGDVTSRLETPFKREAPSVLAEASVGQDGPVSAITVQTGDTLWAIARDRYGEGLLFVRVFEANVTSIRDPNLIYPGQVFDLPTE